MDEKIKFSVSRVDTFPQHIPRADDKSGLTYNDKYVIHYDFSDIGAFLGHQSLQLSTPLTLDR